MYRHRVLVPLAALLLCCRTDAISYGASVSDTIAGRRAQFSHRPGWVNSGAFVLGGDGLLLVDALNSEIIRYSLDGRRVGVVPNPDGVQGFPSPSMIQQAGATAYWVENEDGDFHLLDASFYPQRTETRNLLKLLEAPNDLLSVYGWISISSKELLVVGDLRRLRGTVTAFLRIPLDNPSKLEILREINVDDPARRFLLLGNQYVAALDGVPYFLVMGETPYIQLPNGRELQLVRITVGGRRSPVTRPDLPERPGIAGVKEAFAMIERSTLPTGLFGWNRCLYVVMREPAERNRTRWSLVKIDPHEGKVLSTRLLETSARHVTVIPGNRAWAVVEKGAVKGAGQQDVSSFLVVPSDPL